MIGGPEYSKYVLPYTLKGATVDMCYPKEGAFAGVNCQILVKNAPNQDLGAAFMNRMLEPSVQQGLAEAALAAPRSWFGAFLTSIWQLTPANAPSFG